MTALAQASTLRRILHGGQIRSVYQPIVDLDTGAVVGYEGLARGPVGSPLERPDLLFAAAHAEGFVEELEWACPTAALQGALDDVGADRRSLALTPFVAPEVIKLDLRLVQENPSPAIAAIVHAVNAEAERSGALLLAEGIETEEQLEVARALGARYGQGLALRPARSA